MPENLFSSFNISSQGMSVQRLRLNSVAKNIANANATDGPEGKPYQREVVTVKSIGSFENELQNSSAAGGNVRPDQVKILEATVENDQKPPRKVFDPGHPECDEEGYVLLPDINIVSEMVEMIAAQRAFEANTNIVEAAKTIAKESLDI